MLLLKVDIDHLIARLAFVDVASAISLMRVNTMGWKEDVAVTADTALVGHGVCRYDLNIMPTDFRKSMATTKVVHLEDN